MLTLEIGEAELFDENTNTFIPMKGKQLELEHSLVSISKWEAKYKKPFLSREPKTREETIDYIRFMTKTQHVDPMVYECITDDDIRKVNEYIDDPMTATTVKREEGKGSTGKVITSEEIYYYMTAYQIPPEYQKWHFNRLMTLIRVCDEKNKPNKKKSRSQRAKDRAARSKANKARRARMGSRG